MDQAAISESAIVGFLVKEAIAFMKRSPRFSWINDASPSLSRWLSWLLTFIGSFGVVMTCAGSASGGWDCRLTIPPSQQLVEFTMRWITAQMSAHLIHELGAKKAK
jgi:hypothetical protein